VALWQFIIATLFVYPKVSLHVFIGSRAAALSDGEQRSHMDTRKPADVANYLYFIPNDHCTLETKIINSVLIGAGILIALVSSWCVLKFVIVFGNIYTSYPRLVYQLMQKHIHQLEGFPDETDRLAAEAIEDVEEGAPLLSDFSDA
jgi:hypothetical protein